MFNDGLDVQQWCGWGLQMLPLTMHESGQCKNPHWKTMKENKAKNKQLVIYKVCHSSTNKQM